jgi:O-antigen ligase
MPEAPFLCRSPLDRSVVLRPRVDMAVAGTRLGMTVSKRIIRNPIRTRQGAGSQLWILVVIPIIAMPFENQYTIVGFSLAKLTIFPLLGWVLLQPTHLLHALRHPAFLFGLAFLGWGAISEGFHPSSDWEFIYRVAQTLAFAALIATVASNRVAFRRILLAMAVVCCFLAIYLIYNFYGSVSLQVTSETAASNLRDSTLREMSLATGINILGYTVGMGAVIALTHFILTKRKLLRVVWGGVYVLCAVGCFIPLSRGALIALVLGSILVISRNLSSFIRPGRMLLFVAVVAFLFSVVPDALTERYSTLKPRQEVANEKPEARAKLLTATLESMPQYWRFGIGSGNYWKQWGRANGFGTLGPHNGFLAAWIFFGLPGFLLLCLTCFAAVRACPSREDKSFESAVLFGFLGMGFVWLLFTHSLYLKPFSVILGLLVGSAMEVPRHLAHRRSVRPVPVRRVRAKKRLLQGGAATTIRVTPNNL